jgi:hypothetical protein
VCFAGAFVGGGRGVAVEHLAGTPAGEAHEVTFAAAGRQEGMGEGVAQLMRVGRVESGFVAASTAPRRVGTQVWTSPPAGGL